MLLQDKKGLSIMIGYVLLVVIAIVMSLVVYQWVKTYIPRDAIECPDDVSISLNDVKYDCDANPKTLEVTVKNNGLFSLAGYFIYATTSSDQELATEDLSGKVEDGDLKHGNSIVFAIGETNTLTPDASSSNMAKTTFSDVGEIYRIELIPFRFQEVEGKIRLASCSDAKVGQDVSCWVEPEVCEPDCTGRECGDDGCSPYDITDCGICTGVGEICDIDGMCVVCTPDCSCASNTCVGETCTDPVCDSLCEGTLEPDCGTRICGPAPNGCGDENSCDNPGCDIDEECSTDGTSCELLCGNSELNDGEECDDGNPDSGDGCSSSCTIEAGWVCDEEEPSGCEINIEYTCTNYCQDLGYGSGTCTSNTGQCTSIPGELMGQGPAVFCEIETYWCCCFSI